MPPELRRWTRFEEMSREAALFIAASAREAAARRGRFTLVLSGGKTPGRLYAMLAEEPLAGRVPWEKVNLFWADERCVPFDDPRSNFAMASGALISRIPLDPRNVHRVPVELGRPSAVAAAYEKELRVFFGAGAGPEPFSRELEGGEYLPVFDLVLLGVGEDGHTASLFPGDAALKEKRRWVAAVPRPPGGAAVPRVTLTLPVINRARSVLMVASGPGKREIALRLAEDPRAGSFYPAAMVAPQGSHLLFFSEEKG